jgi:hypothetical protein
MISGNYTPCLHDPFLILSSTLHIYAFFFPFMRATFSCSPLDLIALLDFDEAPHYAVFSIMLLFAPFSVQTLSSACPQTL